MLAYFRDSSHILALDDEADIGYVFEVDLDYPPEIHESTADFPLAPDHLQVTDCMLSPFMKEYYTKMMEGQSGRGGGYKGNKKLAMTQYHREAYVVHYSILKFYLRKGMVLRDVRRAISFRQERWLEPYIRSNSERRAQSQNAFEKDYYKLKNNALFGKLWRM